MFVYAATGRVSTPTSRKRLGALLGLRATVVAQIRSRLAGQAGISPHSLEITITETPRVNWGIRGQNAADLTLNYRVEV